MPIALNAIATKRGRSKESPVPKAPMFGFIAGVNLRPMEPVFNASVSSVPSSNTVLSLRPSEPQTTCA